MRISCVAHPFSLTPVLTQRPVLACHDQSMNDNKLQEALGMGDYADALTEFIQLCDTPLTIALQGDWGSGKTSLMTLIKNELDNQSKDGNPYLTIWFNTWQYSQFNMSETLALSMMSAIADALAPDEKSDAITTLKRSLWAATRAAVIGGASLVGQADTV